MPLCLKVFKSKIVIKKKSVCIYIYIPDWNKHNLYYSDTFSNANLKAIFCNVNYNKTDSKYRLHFLHLNSKSAACNI